MLKFVKTPQDHIRRFKYYDIKLEIRYNAPMIKRVNNDRRQKTGTTICNVTYIRETGRKFKIRMKIKSRETSQKLADKSTFGKHSNDSKNSTDQHKILKYRTT